MLAVHKFFRQCRHVYLNVTVPYMFCSYRQSIVFVMTPSRICVVDDGFRMLPSMDDLVKYTALMKRLLEELCIPFYLIEDMDQQLRTEFVLNVIKPKLSSQFWKSLWFLHCLIKEDRTEQLWFLHRRKKSERNKSS